MAQNDRPPKIDYVEYTKDYVGEHYSEPLTVNELAVQLYISRPYLSALLLRELGMSFKSYLISYSMEKTANFLTNTALRIREISEAVGYSNYAHLSKTSRNL